jgi:hypothetical protein
MIKIILNEIRGIYITAIDLLLVFLKNDNLSANEIQN